MRKNSIKNTRINQEVRRELSHIIQNGIKDPRIHPMTSVTSVEVAPDLKTCRAYISVLGDESSLKETVEGLKNAEGFIRHELARTVNLRNTPQIRFIADQSIEYGVRMSHLIDDVTEADAASAAIRGDQQEDLPENHTEAERSALAEEEAEVEKPAAAGEDAEVEKPAAAGEDAEVEKPAAAGEDAEVEESSAEEDAEVEESAAADVEEEDCSDDE